MQNGFLYISSFYLNVIKTMIQTHTVLILPCNTDRKWEDKDLRQAEASATDLPFEDRNWTLKSQCSEFLAELIFQGQIYIK